MNLDPLSFALSQVSYLVANLSKKNYKQNSQELSNIVKKYGLEADRYLLRCLFSHVDFSLDGNRNTAASNKDGLQTQLLTQECNNLLYKPALISLLCYAFDNPLHQQKTLKPGPHLFPQLRKLLKLSPVQEVVFGLALQKSRNPELQKLAQLFCKQKLPELINSYTDVDTTRQIEGGLHDTTPEVLHLILSHVGLENLPVLWRRLQRDFPREVVPVVLSPVVYTDCPDAASSSMDPPDNLGAAMLHTGLISLVPELGASFTASVEECKTRINSLTEGEVSPMAVAHIMTAMLLSPPAKPFMREAEYPDEQWNMEVFVTAIKELCPNISWREVVAELDNPKFLVKDRGAFLLLFSGLRLCFDQFAFPVELFYRRWNHADGQYSLLLQILKNPDTFCLVDYPYHPVATECLKAAPESENKEIATWRSQDLIEILLVLGEDSRFMAQIIELFKLPIAHCPDVLMLALLQNPAPMSNIRQEIMSMLLPQFFNMHPNSSAVLHAVWHCAPHTVSARSVVMSGMADWYLRPSDNDQGRLSRILDIAQELKGLTLILSSQTFPFVIDLACLASRRGYLKLDKWITDKIRDHGESFISACVVCLSRRCPQITGKDDPQPKGGQLPTETLSTMLGCLQACINNVSKDLADTIVQMIANCTMLVKQARQSGGVLRHRGLDPFAPFPAAQPAMDPLAGLTSTLQGMGLVPGMSNLSTMASMSAGLGSLVSTPASPSRILPTSQSPFPVYVNQTVQHPAGNSQVVASLVPRGQAPVEKNKHSSIFGDPTKPPSKEVEDEANSYFQCIYNHPPHNTLTIEEVLELLKKFMESKNPHERDVFNCMLKNLFDEYQFFPQYPDKELLITAQLFGGIIENNLVHNYMVLGLALRYVLDALRKSPGSKMYYFGIVALDRFKNKLKEYAKYCEHVAGVQHYRDFPLHLISYVDYGLQSEAPPPTVTEGPLLPPHMAALLHQPKAATPAKAIGSGLAPKQAPLSIANATNIDTLLIATEKEDKMIAPPDLTQDKIGFIFNNLSQLNLQTKCDELRELITKDYWAWMSQYLVLKRVTIEFNFHGLYANFLDALKQPELSRMVLRETYRNIRVLLRSDKGIANFSDRSLLKNLGHWLGMLTLAKNKPILHLDIDLKSLIIEAFTKGQQELLYVIPFIAKIMESCAKSKVFRPTNPWTMAVLNLLAELHQDPTLKLNLKFEIEVLCKALDTEVTKLSPSNVLKDSKRLETIETQMSKLDKAEAAAVAPVAHNMAPVAHAQPKPTLPVQPLRNEEMPLNPPHAPNVVDITASIASNTPGGGTPQPTPTAAIPTPAEPRFHLWDVNAPTFSSLEPHLLQIPPVALFREFPQLKACVRPAVDRAVHEWDAPVTERSVKIAGGCTELVVRKDYSLVPDENIMRQAAHSLMYVLTGAMAMITCRDHMLTSISTNLKAAFATQMRGATKAQQEMAETAANSIAEANMELACAFVQKLAMEKSTLDIDKRLADDYDARKIARAEGRRYCDPAMLTYQAERMPEPVRHPVGGVSLQRYNSVYVECVKSVPGFLPLTERDIAVLGPKEIMPAAAAFVPTGPPMPFPPEDESSILYDKLVELLDRYVQAAMSGGSNPRFLALHGLRETAAHARRIRDLPSAAALLQKAVEGLLDGYNPRENTEQMRNYRDAHLRAIRMLHELPQCGPNWALKQVTRSVTEAGEDIKYNLDAIDFLLRSGLIIMPQFDESLAQSLENVINGINYPALLFAMQMVQVYLVDERATSVICDNDLHQTISMLRTINAVRRDIPNLNNLLEVLLSTNDPTQLSDQPGGSLQNMHQGVALARNREYDEGVSETSEYLFREWVTIYITNPRDCSKGFQAFAQQMNYHGILKSEDAVAKFVKMAVDLCVTNAHASRISDPNNRKTCHYTLDALVRLIYLLIKCTGDANNPLFKLSLLNRVLGVILGCLLVEHETRVSEFDQMPYQRLFIMLFNELTQPDPALEPLSFQIVTSFCHTFYSCRPAKAAKFSYGWLEAIAHRSFITRVMAVTSQQKGWPMYSQLLQELFKFLAPFLRNTDLPKAISILYKGTLRVLLVLLHDFPEFLCDFHYVFCDVIPSNCIQMRNLILSAFPRNMRLPDPFTPNLKVDILQEISQAPRMVANYAAKITPPSFRKDLDNYLKLRHPVTFLSEVRGHLQVSKDPGMNYDTQLMNALVLYVGTQAINQIRAQGITPTMSTIASSAHMDIFQNLGVDLDTEGRYLFLNAIANQLRYPNSHTHYFSCLLLSLFSESNTESIQEQITRVLLERLIVNRPHPWGLLITFIELIKNPTYKFWAHEFVHCATEIEKLFESVARSCMVSKQANPVNEGDQGESLSG